MNWDRIIAWHWQRFLVTTLVIAAASAIRAMFFGGLGRGIPYLTYYPAVMLAALYGGLHSGLLATVVSALLSFYWIQRGYMSPVEWLAMVVFIISCSMISGIAEAMRRAQAHARQEKEKAEAASLAKSRFLASMSHELRTPLNAILGFSSLMRNDSGLSEEQRKTLDIINRSGDHLLGLINDVLDMAKVEAGRISLNKSACNIEVMVRDITELLRERADKKGLQLQLHQSTELPHFVETDSAKLRQILINLAGNAIKYTMDGTVTLRLHNKPLNASEHLLLIIEVEDTGVGISAEDQKRIFEPFFQARKRSTEEGTGLGLAIARQYVELMGGCLTVESVPGKGSKFRVELPVTMVVESNGGETSCKQRQVLSLMPGQGEYRVLIVEDQLENRMLLQRILESVGFIVRVAQNGAEGVAAFKKWDPDFIWMDCRMPVMDGLEASKTIRSLDGGHQVKIVALTASVFKDEQEQIMLAGMDDIIHKPFKISEIYQSMAKHLGVQFIYGDVVQEHTDFKSEKMDEEALANLPQDVRDSLTNSLLNLDKKEIEAAVNRIADLNPPLSMHLSEYARRYQYTAIMRALNASRRDQEWKQEK